MRPLIPLLLVYGCARGLSKCHNWRDCERRYSLGLKTGTDSSVRQAENSYGNASRCETNRDVAARGG